MLWKKKSKGILTCGTETNGARCGRPLLLAPPLNHRPSSAECSANALIRCARAVCPGLGLPQVHLLHTGGCALGDEEG